MVKQIIGSLIELAALALGAIALYMIHPWLLVLAVCVFAFLAVGSLGASGDDS